jgi:hypothetical protein
MMNVNKIFGVTLAKPATTNAGDGSSHAIVQAEAAIDSVVQSIISIIYIHHIVSYLIFGSWPRPQAISLCPRLVMLQSRTSDTPRAEAAPIILAGA